MKTVVRRRRFDRRILWVGLLVFVAVASFAFLSQVSHETNEEVQAASLANFDPGYIISDYQMGNYTSMSEAEIQAFLTSKNSCSNRDYDLYLALSSGISYKWHWADGHFVCLSEEKFGDGETIGTGETAAHIIWQAAQDYRINPQVLIVLLEKETSLITDTIPNNGDYRKATGYGCPDTAACSSKYYGFKNQVRNAAALFRAVLDGGWTNYPLGNNYVQYSPTAECGGSIVNIRSLATSALYRYTPYQPNAAALAAGYGTAYCGAYGNRNFYLYFQDWFGGITETRLTLGQVLSQTAKVANEGSDLTMMARAYVGGYDWSDYVGGGEMIGTTGYGLPLEAVELKLGDGLAGIEYRTHLAKVGWESEYKKDGAISGLPGAGNQVEAVQIRLTGELANQYDVYYRTHVQDIGWTSWVKNDAVSGTVGQAKRVEAIQVKIVKKNFELTYVSHVQDIGWMGWVEDGALSGTTGRAKRVEAMQIQLIGGGLAETLQYRVHVQDIGWMGWVKNGETAGTTGQAKRIEAIEIKLVDALVSKYDIQYRVHVQDIGWMGWVKNGETAGTTGQAKRIEAIGIKLVAK